MTTKQTIEAIEGKQKSKKWFYKAQEKFKSWKVENKYSSDCMTQHITKDKLTEHYSIWPEGGGMPVGVTLTASRVPFIVNLFHEGKTISL